MKFKKTIFFTLFVITVISSCYYDVEEKLYPATNCDTTNLSFINTIYPIIQNNCNSGGCHNTATSSAGISLEGYANVKLHINEPKFMGSLQDPANYIAMPKNAARLSSCKIQSIDQWRKNGAPNN